MRTLKASEKPLDNADILAIIDRLEDTALDPRGARIWPSVTRLKRAATSLEGFRRNTRYAFWAYFAFLSMLLASFMAEPNGYSASMTLLGFIGFLGLLLISFYNHSDFYHAVGRAKGSESPLVIFFLGMPLYFLVYLHLEKSMRDELANLLQEMGYSPS